LLTTRQRVGDGLGDGDAGPKRSTPAVDVEDGGTCSSVRWGKEGATGCGILEQATRAASEDEGSPRDVHPRREASIAGNGTRRDSLSAACTGARREDVGARERTKGAIQSLWGRFYRARRGLGKEWPSMPHGCRSSKHSRGGVLMEEKW
jgi:hypothetical protein